MKKVEIPVSKAYRLINYGPLVLVTSAYGKKRNVATIAWSTPLSSDPALVGVAVYSRHFTGSLISRGKEFAINLPPAGMLKKARECGKAHGSEVDKFKVFGLETAPAAKVSVPLLSECFAHLECELVKKIKIGDHFLFVGKVVAASASSGAVDPSGIVRIKNVRTLHHLGGEEFATLTNIK